MWAVLERWWAGREQDEMMEGQGRGRGRPMRQALSRSSP